MSYVDWQISLAFKQSKRVAVRKARTPKSSARIAEWSEACANLFREKFRLLPSSEVSALGDFVVVNQFGIRALGQTLRDLIEFVGKNGDGNWNRDAFDTEKADVVFKCFQKKTRT